MKCPRCGHWNQPSFPRCFQCGAPLQPSTEGGSGWRKQFSQPQKDKIRILYDDADAQPTMEEFVAAGDEAQKKESLSEEMIHLHDRRARGEKYLETYREALNEQEAEKNGEPSVRVYHAGQVFGKDPVPDQEHPDAQERDKMMAGRVGPEGRYAAEEADSDGFSPLPGEDEDYDDYDDPYNELYDDSLPPTGPAVSKAHRRKKRTHRRKPVLIAVWLVRGLVLCAVGFFIWQGSTILRTYLQTSATSGKNVDALIEACEIDGQPGHRITIPAEEGTQCYIGELTKSYVAVNGVITIQVADYVFYEDIEHLEAETMTVELTPTMIYMGNEERMAPITYEIDIPATTLMLISPESTWMEVTTSIYNVRLQVDPGSSVVINGVDVSDTVSDDGVVDYNPAVQAIGDNIVSITARAPYARESRLVITLYREPMSIPIELSADVLSETSDKEMTINATTRVGATITMDTPYQSIDDSQLNETGKFTVVALMSHVGYNDITIRASYPGLEDSTLTHRVYYLPTADVYTPMAWALTSADYSELLNNIALRVENAQVYLCEGTITQIISEKPQLAIMDTGKEGSEQLVMLQNETATTWELGKRYRVYADVCGLYGTMPKFMARYTYSSN